MDWIDRVLVGELATTGQAAITEFGIDEHATVSAADRLLTKPNQPATPETDSAPTINPASLATQASHGATERGRRSVHVGNAATQDRVGHQVSVQRRLELIDQIPSRHPLEQLTRLGREPRVASPPTTTLVQQILTNAHPTHCAPASPLCGHSCCLVPTVR